MDKPNPQDVDVILKLYELRREERMRKAYFSNLETVAQALIDRMNSANPKAYEMFAARACGAGA